jgi:hypothetical protein
VPLAAAPLVMSKHLLSLRSVPSSLFQTQFWAIVPLQAKNWIAAPLSVLAPASSMHLLAAPRIGPSPRYFRFDDGRCVEVATGVDRMCATQILALSPVERSGAAARRPANREASDIGTIPNLLGKEIAVIGGIGHRLQVDICGAAVRDLVLPVFLRKNKPKPPVIIRSVDDPPPRAIAVALTVDIAAGHRDLQRRVAVRCANRAGNSKVAVRFAHEPYFDHTQSIIGLKQNWFKDVGITFEPDNKGIVVNAGDVSAVYSSGRVEGEFQDGVIQAQFGEVDLDSLGD